MNLVTHKLESRYTLESSYIAPITLQDWTTVVQTTVHVESIDEESLSHSHAVPCRSSRCNDLAVCQFNYPLSYM